MATTRAATYYPAQPMTNTTTCPACGAANPADAKFCGSCGAAVNATCPRCGHRNPSDGSFCLECGAALATSALDATLSNHLVRLGEGPLRRLLAGVPRRLIELLRDSDAETGERVTEAMLKMGRMDLEALERAADAEA